MSNGATYEQHSFPANFRGEVEPGQDFHRTIDRVGNVEGIFLDYDGLFPLRRIFAGMAATQLAFMEAASKSGLKRFDYSRPVEDPEASQ